MDFFLIFKHAELKLRFKDLMAKRAKYPFMEHNTGFDLYGKQMLECSKEMGNIVRLIESAGYPVNEWKEQKFYREYGEYLKAV